MHKQVRLPGESGVSALTNVTRRLSKVSLLHKNTPQLCGSFRQLRSQTHPRRTSVCVCVCTDAFFGTAALRSRRLHSRLSATNHARWNTFGTKNSESPAVTVWNGLKVEPLSKRQGGDRDTDCMGSKVTVQQQRRRQMEALERHRASERAIHPNSAYTHTYTHRGKENGWLWGQTSIKHNSLWQRWCVVTQQQKPSFL